ncbi:MAG TPA: ATP-binding protein [Xanthobacteraceae bacterium]|nr:ATP-binding protein [Xanthobacteraceae bacterium]
MQPDQLPGHTASVVAPQPLARVLSVSGAAATIRLSNVSRAQAQDDVQATVGKFLAIQTSVSSLVGVITKVAAEQGDNAVGHVDLLGEIKRDGQRAYFQRGVTEYPLIGDEVHLLTHDELQLIYAIRGPRTIHVGTLQQDASIAAHVDVDEMVRKHFAVFGTTGVGKSTGIALLLREVLGARPDLRLFLIDPHNEYGRSFDDRALVLNPRNLKLPFWLFNFEEIIDVFFRGRPGVEEEVAILADAIPMAKAAAAGPGASDRLSLRKSETKSTGFTPDTPVPYRLSDLIALIDEKMGRLENKSFVTKYNRLISRIEMVRNDPRYSFMFDNANVGGDTMAEVLSQLFRLPDNGKPMTIMQLAGFPAEVVDSVVSVMCRMAFEFGLWSDGVAPLLFVCEESHRYAPADRTIGFGPTRKAISRIAKEGRKYGVFLGLITQRPAELDPTIISQCSTLFAMRMANDRDQAIVRSAVSDAAGGLLSLVPSLGTREVFAFGEGVALPTRLKFKELASQYIPRSEAIGNVRVDKEQALDATFIAAVVQRWRGAMMSHTAAVAQDDGDRLDALAAEEFGRLQRVAAPAQAPTMPAPAPSKPAPAPAHPLRTNGGSPPSFGGTNPNSFAFPAQPPRGGGLRK